MAAISIVLLAFWILGSAIGLDVTAAALIAVAALLLTGVLGALLWPAIGALMAVVAGMFGLSMGDLVKLTSII